MMTCVVMTGRATKASPAVHSIRLSLILCALLAAPACGSGSASSNPDSGMVTGGGAGLSWKDDGTLRRANLPTAILGGSSTLQMLQISGGEASGLGISFGVAMMPPPLVMGQYTCAPAMGYPVVSIAYTAPGVGVRQSCTINITTPGDAAGAHATGTFSAVFPLAAGGTKSLTEGVFDLPVSVFGI